MRVILSDLDGVLADSTSEACETLWLWFNKLMTPDEVLEYNVGKVFTRLHDFPYDPVDKLLQEQCWEHAQFYDAVSVYWSVWKTYLRLLEMEDIQLVFVTARADCGKETYAIRHETRRWLDRHGFKECEVHYLAGQSRIDWILQDRGDAPVTYIDDKAETIKDLLAQRPPVSSVQPFLLNRPWNRPQFGVHDDCELQRISESTLPFILLGKMA
jgi:hypothetical protein